jgi:hypothetical protein
MNQQSMRVGRRGRRRQTRTLRERREQVGYREPLQSRSKIIMLSRIAPNGYRWLSACPQVPAAIAKLHSFLTIQMYGRPSCDRFRCSQHCQGRPAEEPILRPGVRCIDHEQAN